MYRSNSEKDFVTGIIRFCENIFFKLYFKVIEKLIKIIYIYEIKLVQLFLKR